MPKGKKLGRGLAALISDNRKKPRNMKDDDDEPAEDRGEDTSKDLDDEVLKKWADAKQKEKSDSDQGSKGEDPRKPRDLDSKKRKEYEAKLDAYRVRREKAYSEKAKNIDPDIPQWKEEEYTSPLDADYFDRNSKGTPRERYEKLLEKHKK